MANEQGILARITNNDQQDIRIKAIGISVRTIGGLDDVDVSNNRAGSVLVYNAVTKRWTSTTTLNAQDIDGGTY